MVWGVLLIGPVIVCKLLRKTVIRNDNFTLQSNTSVSLNTE